MASTLMYPEVETGEQRLQRTHAALAAAGLPLPEHLYPYGTALLDVGHETMRTRREEFLKRPLVTEAVPLMRAWEAAQERRTSTCRVGDVALGPGGRLVPRHLLPQATPDQGPILDKDSLRQLLERAEVPGASQIASAGEYMHPRELVSVVNDRLSRFDLGQGPTMVVKSQGLMVKRQIQADAPGELVPLRSVRAILSEKYADVTDADVGAMLAQAAPGARMSWEMGPHITTWDLAWWADIEQGQHVVGDVYQAGIRVKSSETGRSAIHVHGLAWCVRCINATTAEVKGQKSSIRHVGSPHERARETVRAIAAARNAILPLLQAIEHNGSVVSKVGADETWSRTKAALSCSEKHLGLVRDTYQAKYQLTEGQGISLWGLTGAVTEAAQVVPMAVGQDWEDWSGAVLQNRTTQVRLGF